ncbi:MAG: DUF2298 domain-containing protein [Dehalococcoidia bacterium]
MQKKTTTSILFLIIFFTLLVRLYGINWDNGTLFHPDERAMLSQVYDISFPEGREWNDFFDAEKSTLNPGSFNWGSMPQYALKLIQYAYAPIDWLDIYELRYPGRILSSIFDTISVIFVFLISRYIFDNKVAILSAFLTSISVIHIQLSHFYAVDTFSTAFVLGTLYYAIKVGYEGGRKNSLFTGVMFGFALTTKFSVIPLVVPAVLAHIIFQLSDNKYDRLRIILDKKEFLLIIKNLIYFSFSTFLILLIFQPYMFIDLSTYIHTISTQGDMVRRNIDFPFTRQYIDTPKYLYQIIQTGIWGLGPILGIMGWLGLFLSIISLIIFRRKSDIIIISWICLYFFITGWFDVKFLRYMLPLTPFLIIYASRLIFWLVGIIRALKPDNKWMNYFPIIIVVIFTLHYSLSFMNIYSGNHPSVEASNWLEKNADTRSIVVHEHWDEGIPHNSKVIFAERLELYNYDNYNKFETISSQLENADYFVIVSNRLYATIPRLSERYPISTLFYKKLFSGELGYEISYTNNRPIGGLGVEYHEDLFARLDFNYDNELLKSNQDYVSINFGWSDESFSVYDHPRIFIFENKREFSSQEILDAIGLQNNYFYTSNTGQLGLVYDEQKANTQLGGGNWSSIFYISSIPNIIYPVIWYTFVLFLSLITLPITWSIFKKWPEGGYLFSKPLGIILASIFTWISVSYGLVQYNILSVLIGYVLLGLISYWLVRINLSNFKKFIHNNFRNIIKLEFLFLFIFSIFLFLRMANPDLWHPYKGGEKPMDFAYLNAVIKSTIFPPYDPWYSGGYLNYYYYGQFIISNLIKTTGIPTSIAYNLAIPLIAALTFTVSFSLIRGVTYLSNVKSAKNYSIYAGLLGGFLVTFAGNIDGLYQLISILRNEAYSFDFWNSSRLMNAQSGGFEITEFPFFTFLFADLHAHLIAIPFALLSISITFAIYTKILRNDGFYGQIFLALLLGLILGAIRIINTWDFPTQLLIIIFIIFFGYLLYSTKPKLESIFFSTFLIFFVIAFSYIPFIPFYENYELFNNGINRSKYYTDLKDFININLFFLFVAASFIVINYKNYFKLIEKNYKKFILKKKKLKILFVVFFIIFLSINFSLLFTNYVIVGLSILFVSIIIIYFLLSHHNKSYKDTYFLPITILLIFGFALSAGVEIFTVKDDIGRMNTVFKFYIQAWILFSLASSYFLWKIFSYIGFNFGSYTSKIKIWAILLLIMIFSISIYTLYGTKDRNQTRFNTNFISLDGMEYMKSAEYYFEDKKIDLIYDYMAIEWIKKNIDGSPTIIEGITDQYQWGNRISIYTGLPSVVGWDWHQRQQRVEYAYSVTSRRSDVQRFYHSTLPRTAIEIIDKYDIKYVIVGELEEHLYTNAGLEKFEKMQSQGLIKIYPNDMINYETPVRIYKYID